MFVHIFARRGFTFPARFHTFSFEVALAKGAQNFQQARIPYLVSSKRILFVFCFICIACLPVRFLYHELRAWYSLIASCTHTHTQNPRLKGLLGIDVLEYFANYMELQDGWNCSCGGVIQEAAGKALSSSQSVASSFSSTSGSETPLRRAAHACAKLCICHPYDS